MILNWLNWKEFRSIEKSFNDVANKDHNISYYQTELGLWSHINKDIGLELHNWVKYRPIGLGLIKS